MLTFDPQERISPYAAVRHPFFTRRTDDGSGSGSGHGPHSRPAQQLSATTNNPPKHSRLVSFCLLCSWLWHIGCDSWGFRHSGTRALVIFNEVRNKLIHSNRSLGVMKICPVSFLRNTFFILGFGPRYLKVLLDVIIHPRCRINSH